MPIGMPQPAKPGTRISISAAGGDVSGNAPDAPAKRQDPAATFYQQWVNEIHNPPQAPPGATGAAAAGGSQQGPAPIPAQRTKAAVDDIKQWVQPQFTLSQALDVARSPSASMGDKLRALQHAVQEGGWRQLAQSMTMPVTVPGTNFETVIPMPGGKLWDVPIAMGQDIARGVGAPEWAGGLAGVAIPSGAGKLVQQALKRAPGAASMPTFSRWAGALKPNSWERDATQGMAKELGGEASAVAGPNIPPSKGIPSGAPTQGNFDFTSQTMSARPADLGGPRMPAPEGPTPGWPPDPRQRQFSFGKATPVGKATYDEVTPAGAGPPPPTPQPNPAAIGAAPKMKPVGTKQASSGVQTAVKAPSAATATATPPVAAGAAPKAPIGAQNMMDFVGQNWQRLPPQHRDQFMQLTNSWNSANAVGNEGAKQQAMSDMYDMVMRAVAGGGA